MPKIRTKVTISNIESDPLDIVTEEICIKEESIDEIKKEVVDLDFDNAPVSDIPNNIKEEEVTNDNILIDPKDIPGIEKIVNIEDILKKNISNIDSTNLLNSKNANIVLQNSETSFSNNSSASRKTTSSCNCMAYIEHYCITCKKVIKYNMNKTECPDCKTLLKLKCPRCTRKYKFLSSTHQYILQCSKRLNLLSNKKKEIIFKCQKQINFSCSVCLFKTDNKEIFTQHVKSHSVIEEVKQNDHSKINKDNNANDEFIKLYCTVCSKTKKNETYDKKVTYNCEECHKIMFYKCTFCVKLYKSLTSLRAHLHEHTISYLLQDKCQEPTFQCDHCHLKIKDKFQLEVHIRLLHTPVTCQHCKKEFRNSSSMKRHITKGCSVERDKKMEKVRKANIYNLKLQKNETEVFKKTESINSTPRLEKGTYQILQYHPDDLYKEISSKPPKSLHSLSWQSLIDYYCLLCDGQADKKFSKYKPWCPKCKIKYEYRCKTCQKLYGGYASMYKHVKSECRSQFTLECSMCDFISACKQDLISHIKNKHTIFKCLSCGSRYHGYLSLRKHLLSTCKHGILHPKKHMHKLIAMYCKHCHQSILDFKGSSLTPCVKCTSVMSFQCLKCKQLFNDSKMVNNHVRNECKPSLNCAKCNYKSYIQHELDVHMKDVHTKKICPDCGVQFKDEQIFKLHRLEEIRQEEEKQKFLSNWKTKRIKIS